MKSRKLIGMVSGVMVMLCFVLTGCKTDTEPPAEPKTIVITGFQGTFYSGKIAVITLHPSLVSDNVTAVGGTQISASDRLTFPLKTDDSLKTDWRGSGDYILLLMVGTNSGTADPVIEDVFIYSQGQYVDENTINLPKYSITEKTSTIQFSMFTNITDFARSEGLIE